MTPAFRNESRMRGAARRGRRQRPRRAVVPRLRRLVAGPGSGASSRRGATPSDAGTLRFPRAAANRRAHAVRLPRGQALRRRRRGLSPVRRGGRRRVGGRAGVRHGSVDRRRIDRALAARTRAARVRRRRALAGGGRADSGHVDRGVRAPARAGVDIPARGRVHLASRRRASTGAPSRSRCAATPSRPQRPPTGVIGGSMTKGTSMGPTLARRQGVRRTSSCSRSSRFPSR